jgi:hypothetical protein
MLFFSKIDEDLVEEGKLGVNTEGENTLGAWGDLAAGIALLGVVNSYCAHEQGANKPKTAIRKHFFILKQKAHSQFERLK